MPLNRNISRKTYFQINSPKASESWGTCQGPLSSGGPSGGASWETHSSS